MRILVLPLVASLMFASAATAQGTNSPSWRAPDGRLVSSGIVASRIVANNQFVFSAQYISCAAGRPALLFVAAGEGPHVGPAALTIGNLRETVTFVRDDALQPVFNAGVARADISPTLIAAMARSPSMTMSGVFQQPGLPPRPFSQNVSLRGFAERMPAIERQCGQALGTVAGPTPGPMAGERASSPFEGQYRGRLSAQTLEIRRRPSGDFAITVNASVPGCGAEVRVIATEANGVLRSQRTDPRDGPTDACRLTFTRTAQGVSVRHEDGCFGNHGMRCDFNAQYTRR